MPYLTTLSHRLIQNVGSPPLPSAEREREREGELVGLLGKTGWGCAQLAHRMAFKYVGSMTEGSPEAQQKREQFRWMEWNYSYSFGNEGAIAESLRWGHSHTFPDSYKLLLAIPFRGQEYWEISQFPFPSICCVTLGIFFNLGNLIISICKMEWWWLI